MAYLAAFAGMRPVHLAVVTTAGRLPSVLAITLGSSFAAAGDWRATAMVSSVTAAAVVIGALAYHRFKRQHDGRRGKAGEVGPVRERELHRKRPVPHKNPRRSMFAA